MEKHTGTVIARSEAGEELTILEYTDFIDIGTFSDPRGVAPGRKSLLTLDGRSVNRIQKGKYEIV